MPEGIPKDHRGLVAVGEETEKRIYLRKGQRGGLYFFSPSGKYIYFMNGQQCREGDRLFGIIPKPV